MDSGQRVGVGNVEGEGTPPKWLADVEEKTQSDCDAAPYKLFDVNYSERVTSPRWPAMQNVGEAFI